MLEITFIIFLNNRNLPCVVLKPKYLCIRIFLGFNIWTKLSLSISFFTDTFEESMDTDDNLKPFSATIHEEKKHTDAEITEELSQEGKF